MSVTTSLDHKLTQLKLSRMREVVAGSAVLGFATNLSYLGRVLASGPFRAANVHTGFLLEHHRSLVSPELAPEAIIAAAALSDAEFTRAWDETPALLRSMDSWRNG